MVTPDREIRLVVVVAAAYLAGDMLDQLLSVPLSSRRGLGADVDEIPGQVVAAGAEHVALGVVQERQELVEEAALALGGELVLQAPEAAAQDGAPVVHVLARRHPVGSPGVGGGQSCFYFVLVIAQVHEHCFVFF